MAADGAAGSAERPGTRGRRKQGESVAQPSGWYPSPPSQWRQERGRLGRWPAVLGIVLALVVVLVVADRAAAAVAGSQLRSRVAQELQARQVGYASLDVTVGGVPFVTQVVRGRYESIRIDMTDVRLRAGDLTATLSTLQVVATGVHADAAEVARGEASVVAERVAGRAIVSYAGLTGLVDLRDYAISDLTFEERDGALHASATVNVGGLSLPIAATAEVSLRDSQIHLRFRDAAAVGLEMPPAGLAALDALVNAVIVVTIPPLPFDVTLDTLEVTPVGLRVGAVGRNITIVQPTRP